MNSTESPSEKLPVQPNFSVFMGLVIIFFLPLSMVAHKGIAPLFILAVLGSVTISFQYGRLHWRPRLLEWVMGFCILLAIVSVIWSITPSVTLRTAVSFGATLAGGVFLLRQMQFMRLPQAPIFSEFIIYGGVVGFLVLGIDLLNGAQFTVFVISSFGRHISPTNNPLALLNAATSMGAIFVWIWILALQKRVSVKLGVPLAILAFTTIFQSEAATPLLATFVGLIVFSASVYLPKWAPIMVSILILMAAIFAPLIAANVPNPAARDNNVEFISNSAAHRLLIWRNTASHIKENPILGLGFDTSRALYSREDSVKVDVNPGSDTRKWSGNFEPIPLHPHNGVLQIWLEFGVFGVAAFLALLFVIFQAITRTTNDRIEKALCFGAVTSALTVFSLSFGAWQSWWLAALFLLASCAVGLVSKTLPTTNK